MMLRSRMNAYSYLTIMHTFLALLLPSRDAVKRFDTDGSGDISCAELHVLLRELKLDIDLDYTRRLLGVYKNWHASDMPELKDHKSGGVSLETALSLEEFTPLYHDLVAGTPPVPRPKVDPEILRIFREHDADCNGEIDLTELGALLESIGLPMDPTALAAVIHNFSQGTSALNASQLEGVVRFARLAARQMNLPVHSGGGAAAEESASTASTGDAPPPNGSQTPSSPSAALKGTVSSVHWSATA
jgi:Ca2+-binding EF-hand superfamily protein